MSSMETPRPVPHHRPRRARGAPASELPETLEPAYPGPSFARVFRGRMYTFNLGNLPRKQLADGFARIAWDTARDQRTKLHNIGHAARRFSEFLDARDPQAIVATLADVSPTVLDDFKTHLDMRYARTSDEPHAIMRTCIGVFSRACELNLAHPLMRRRTTYVSTETRRRRTPPVDAIDPVTMSGLRKAAKTDVDLVVKRIARGHRIARSGRDPLNDGWWSVANLAWHFHNHGCDLPHEAQLNLTFRHRTGVTYTKVINSIFPAPRDHVGFVILIAEQTGIPIESVYDLKVDCLRNENNGYATLHYVKWRDKGRPHKTQTVPTRGVFSTGGLIKTYLALSERARAFASEEEAQWLLICQNSFNGHRMHRVHRSPALIKRFLRDHRVEDSSGNRVEGLQLRRVRKSAHRTAYRHRGDLASVAQKLAHSVTMSAKRYAMIPMNLELHEEAITAGLKSAFDGAISAVIAGDRAKNGPDANEKTGGRKADDPPGDREDVAVAECRDFFDSPYAEAPGMPCGAPLFGCLNCANAVITADKLPALIELLEDILDKRQAMDLMSWRAVFGDHYARILTILDRFPRDPVARAREQAASASGRHWSAVQLAYKV